MSWKRWRELQKRVNAYKKNDFEALGHLMYETHNGLQNEYEVSCSELDFLVQQTHNDQAVLGARMMGGGFGGCTINLVKKAEYPQFITRMKTAYKTAFNIDLPCYEVVLSNGTEVETALMDKIMV